MLACTLAAAVPAHADAVADFYRGKTFSIVIGYPPGGAYDIYARAIARHIGKHLPGNPQVVTQNMPGAGSLAATQYIYSRPADGLFVGALHGAVINGQVTGAIQGQFDPQKLIWLGQIGSGSVPRLFLVRPEIATNLEHDPTLFDADKHVRIQPFSDRLNSQTKDRGLQASYIIGGDGKQYGPVPATVLLRWITDGRVDAETPIQVDGSSAWVKLHQLGDALRQLAGKRK